MSRKAPSIAIISIAITLWAFDQAASRNDKVQNDANAFVWETVERVTSANLRGLDATNCGIIWASGTDGEVLRSADSGEVWTSHAVPNCAGVDFRDTEGFDAHHAAVMSSGNGVKIFWTNDGGKKWSLSYEDTNRNIFFNGMDFSGAKGMAYGDPINGRMTLLKSNDSGQTWIALDSFSTPQMNEGEAGFAASGTGIVTTKTKAFIATGGSASRVLSFKDSTWTSASTPLRSATSAGIFSMDFSNDSIGIIVGGDYVDSTNSTRNAAYSIDGGSTWKFPCPAPAGYRSCVAISDSETMAIATGRSGTDISYDAGKSWQTLSDQGFFSCVIVGNRIIGVGRNGKMGCAILPSAPTH